MRSIRGGMCRVLDVAVVGCGTAGPAVSLGLAAAGHRVTLFERVPDPGPVGAGIILQPTGQAALARLGLHDHVVPRGARLAGLRIETSRGKTLARLAYAGVPGDRFGVGLHRGLLFQALFGAVKRAPIELRLGVSVESLRERRGGRVELFDDAATSVGAYDLAIVADGARSHLRDAGGARLDKIVRPYRWGALWFVGEDRGGSGGDELYQVVEGTARMVGLLPTGRGPRPEAREADGPASADDPPHVSFYWSVRADRAEAIREGDLGAFKREVLRLMPAAEPVLEQIADARQLLFARYHDVVMRRWHEHNVVYIGDAAHAMSPQLGQGCNLALVDAMVLVDCIAAHPRVDEALVAYSDARRAHLDFYQFATRWLTPFFQSDAGALGALRDAFMGLVQRVPFVRRQMIDMMCGAKRGVFARPLALPWTGERALLAPSRERAGG